MIKNFLLLLTCLVIFGHARAADERSLLLEGGISTIIAFRDGFEIDLDDQVIDGCLPRPSRMKDLMELTLRQNGFSMVPNSSVPNKIKITAIGYELGSSSCVINIRAELEMWVLVVVPYTELLPDEKLTLVKMTHSIGSSVLTGPKSGMQSRVESKVKDYGNELFLDISRSKDHVSKYFPKISEFYKSQLQ